METYQDQVLAFLKGEMSGEERKAFEESLSRSAELRAELERSRDLLDLMEAASEQAIARRVEKQIHPAIDRKASDIHLVPGAHETIVSIRIDGELKELERFPRELHQAVVDRWKLLADCSLTERQAPQEGRFLVAHEQKEFDLRVTVMPTVLGERVTTRILSKEMHLVLLHQLGLSSAQLQAVQRMVRRPSGILPVTGRAGSGKTNTLYALLLDIKERLDGRANIMTVEEPVAMVLDGISQTRVNRRSGLGYAAALRAVYRSDPDIVLIGELPDPETTKLAFELAATGHLVLAQLSGKSILEAIEWMRGAGIDSFLIAQTLVGGIGQRLLRRVCSHCREAYEPAPAALRRVGLTTGDGSFYHGRGCEACRNTGYKGRIALFEIVEMSETLRQLIVDNASAEAMWQAAFGENGSTLWDDAKAKVREGATTVEEVVRVLFDYPPPVARPPGG